MPCWAGLNAATHLARVSLAVQSYALSSQGPSLRQVTNRVAWGIDLVYAFLGGAGVDVIGNRISGSLGNGNFPLNKPPDGGGR